MSSLASLQTGQFVVKRRVIKRTRLWRAALCVAIVLVGWALFELGRYAAGFSVLDAAQRHWQLRQQIDTLQKDRARLAHQLRSSEMTAQMEQKTVATLQQSVAELQANLQQQNEELVFYRGIIEPQLNGTNRPTVQRAELQPGVDARHLKLHLVLIQSMQGNAQATGSLNVTVNGVRHGESVVLSLRELAPTLNADMLKFSYRYFQNLDQAIELPADVEPQGLQLELRANGHPVQTQHYDWQIGALRAKT